MSDSLVNGTSGVYTPSLTNTLNISGSTAYECQYLRVGKTVTVSGRVDIDPTGAGHATLGMSLPIASDFGAVEDCAGTGIIIDAQEATGIIASVANNTAVFDWIAINTANAQWAFIFTYQVI